MNTIPRGDMGQDYRDRLFTPSRQWGEEMDNVDFSSVFKKNIYNLYLSNKLMPWSKELRTKLCLFFYFKENYKISSFIYKDLYDECCVAKDIFYSKSESSEEEKARMDAEIFTELIDLTKFSSGLEVEVSSSDDFVAVIQNNIKGTTLSSGPTGISA